MLQLGRLITCLACGVLALTTRAEPAAAEFPFELREGFIWIDVRMEGAAQPLKFLLDTGAQVSVLDQEVARGLGLKAGKSVPVFGVQTTVKGLWPQPVNASAAGVKLPSKVLVTDLGALGRACTTSVDGLLGADFFRGKIVQVDFPNGKVRLLSRAEARRVEGDQLKLEFRDCGMRVAAEINGEKRQWLRVDTGCAAPLHWVTRSIDPAQCRREMAIGLAQLSLPSTTVNVALGSQTFFNVPAAIHERPIFQGENGLLGLGLLSRFSRVTIDAGRSRLILSR